MFEVTEGILTEREIPVVADDDDGEFGVEGDVGEFRFLLGRDKLFTDRFILVDVQVKHVCLEHTHIYTHWVTVFFNKS